VIINNLIRDIYKNVYAVSKNGDIIIKLNIIYTPINFLELNVCEIYPHNMYLISNVSFYT